MMKTVLFLLIFTSSAWAQQIPGCLPYLQEVLHIDSPDSPISFSKMNSSENSEIRPDSYMIFLNTVYQHYSANNSEQLNYFLKRIAELPASDVAKLIELSLNFERKGLINKIAKLRESNTPLAKRYNELFYVEHKSEEQINELEFLKLKMDINDQEIRKLSTKKYHDYTNPNYLKKFTEEVMLELRGL